MPQVSISWVDLLLIGAASGAVAAAVSGAFTFWSEKSRNRHDLSLRNAEKADENLNRFLPMAIGAKNWIKYDFGDRYGHEVGYFVHDAPTPDLASPSEAIRTLETIGDEHPDQSVRAIAQKLASSIDDAFNMHDGPEGRPTWDEMTAWQTAAEELMDAIRCAAAEASARLFDR